MAFTTWNDLCTKHDYTPSEYQPICVVLAFTKNYMPGAVPLVRSLVKNLNHRVEFKVFHRNLGAEDKIKLSQCVKRNFSFFSVDDTALTQISYTWWMQAFFCQFVHEYEYMLYIDVDIIVNAARKVAQRSR